MKTDFSFSAALTTSESRSDSGISQQEQGGEGELVILAILLGLLTINEVIRGGAAGGGGQPKITNFETGCCMILAKVRNGNHLLQS